MKVEKINTYKLNISLDEQESVSLINAIDDYVGEIDDKICRELLTHINKLIPKKEFFNFLNKTKPYIIIR